MIEKKTKTVLLCTCEHKDCGKSWESNGEETPARCRWCGRHSWNGVDLRVKHLITVGNKTLSVSDWAERTGLKKSTIRQRLRDGWTPEQSVSIPTLSEGRT